MADPPRDGWSAKHHDLARAAGYPTWDAWVTWLEGRSRYQAICAARNRADRPCARPAGWGTAHVGTGRCKLHFGNTAVGPGHTQYKHGRYTTTVPMPADILARREAAATDPELLSLAKQIATVDAKEDRLLAALAELDAAPRPEPQPNEDSAAYAKRVRAWRAQREDVWADLYLWADQKRKLVDAEMKLRVAHHDMLTRDQLRLLVDWVAMSLREALEAKVTDTAQRNAAYTMFAHRMRQFQARASTGG